jgi:hypothetical protein
VKACGGKRAELVAPGIPGFGKAMAQKHQRPLALLGDMEADAVRFDGALRGFVHTSLSKLTLIHSLKGECIYT